MRDSAHKIVLFLLVCCLVVSGCAQTHSVLRYNVNDAQPQVWPSEPEKPRYRYVGELTGEQNILNDSKERSFGSKLLGWLTGLVTGKRKPTVLQRPQGVYVDQAGRIYISDVSRSAVYVFNETEGTLDVWDMAGKNIRFMTPVGMTEDSSGDLLVVDADLGYVVRLNQQGQPVGKFGKGLFKRPTGIAYDAVKGRIFVADTHENNIKIFDEAGNLLDTLGEFGNQEGQFNSPTYLVYRDEQLYVTDTLNSRIQIFSASGDYIRSIGKRGLYVGDLPRPKGVAVDQDNNIYVVESYYDYLLVFSDKGEFLLPIGGTGSGVGEFYLPAGVCTDQRNRVYVADAFNGRVVILQYLGAA
jgi:DNA-binding beta-propeller fold protein YncE